MTQKERVVFRVKAGDENAAPYLATLKERFPEMNESEIIRMSLKFAATGSAA
jgi:hypothetical protein